VLVIDTDRLFQCALRTLAHDLCFPLLQNKNSRSSIAALESIGFCLRLNRNSSCAAQGELTHTAPTGTAREMSRRRAGAGRGTRLERAFHLPPSIPIHEGSAITETVPTASLLASPADLFSHTSGPEFPRPPSRFHQAAGKYRWKTVRTFPSAAHCPYSTKC